jgi:hypothetical protein
VVGACACCPACDSFFLQPSSPIELTTNAAEATTAMTCWELCIEVRPKRNILAMGTLDIC